MGTLIHDVNEVLADDPLGTVLLPECSAGADRALGQSFSIEETFSLLEEGRSGEGFCYIMLPASC
jgi:hypothetical protein